MRDLTEDRQFVETAIRRARVREATAELVALMIQQGRLVELDQIVGAIKRMRDSLERLDSGVDSTAGILRSVISRRDFSLEDILDSIVPIGAALNEKEEH